MFILITGENNSGKSACAEKIAGRIGGRMVYAATMIPCGGEGRARVEKHRRQRAGMGFVTVECPRRLRGVDADEKTLVLLEDLSNLLANNLFDGESPASAASVFDDVKDLQARCGTLIAVTIDGLSPEGYEEKTRNYIQSLNWLNDQLAREADALIEMRGGSACLRKGECPWF